MKDYHDYLQETEGQDRGCVWNDKGWASYKITGQECYIDQIYIKTDFREDKAATELADKVVKLAKEKGCCVLIGTVHTNEASFDIETGLSKRDRSVKVLLGYGFRPLRFNEGVATFLK